MPEAATIDAPPQEAGPSPSGPGFNTMVEQLEKGMAEVRIKPAEQQPVIPDTRPVEQKPVEKIQKTEPAQPAKPAESEPFVSPKAADWKKLKAERDELHKKATEHETTAKTHAERAAALEKEYSEYKAKTTFNPEEIETLKKDRESAHALLERVALEQTPKFRDYYNSKFEGALAQALDTVGKDKAEQVRAVLEAPKSAWRKGILNELVEGMESQVDRLNLIAAVNEYDRTRDERSKQLDNHKSALKELQAHETKSKKDQEERATALRQANQKTLIKETLAKAENYESFKANDDPAHNAQVAKNKKVIEQMIEGTIEDSVTLMLPIMAAEGERLTKVTADQKAKIAELEEALAKYKTAQPALEGSGAPAGEKTAKSYTEQVMEGLLSIPK